MDATARRAALELEFERLKQRADTYERMLAGSEDEWLQVQIRLGGEVAEVTLDKTLAEARQNALAMATILRALDGAKVEASAAPAADPSDEIGRRREARLKEAQQAAGQVP